MKGMFHNEVLLEKDNNKIHRWNLWLDGFSFDIEYTPRKTNYLVDLVTT
jgi:hypothetical protein